MVFTRFSKEKILPILINRAVLFLLIMCLLILFLYFAGTIQDFMDSTQFLLLNLYYVLGIFLTLTSFGGVILDLGRFLKAKKLRYLLRAGGYLSLVIFGTITVFFITAIIAISGGNRV